MPGSDRAALPFESALLHEVRHRHANELACALAALRLTRAGSSRPQPLIEEAIDRIEANVRIERLLLSPSDPDLGDILLQLCSLLARTNAGRPRFRVRLIARPCLRDPDELRLVLLVGYELLQNAAKRWRAGDPEIAVRVGYRRGILRLTVVNHIEIGQEQPLHRPRGLETVARLVGLMEGRVATATEGRRFVAQIVAPIDASAEPASRKDAGRPFREH